MFEKPVPSLLTADPSHLSGADSLLSVSAQFQLLHLSPAAIVVYLCALVHQSMSNLLMNRTLIRPRF